ncbi:MAG: cytochrome c3 family protein [Gammaproteobacteria bacterium]
MGNNSTKWIYWLVISLLLTGYLVYRLYGDDKTLYSPGAMTHGHYQIEMSCASCHTSSFGGGEVLQDACMNCHGAELKEARDSHPKSKFTDPRNASRVKKLDARVCVTCHTEHKQEIAGEMGLTLPGDYCFKCHQDIADDRPSHQGMEFNSCGTAGCHNYHDNTALYEDFLEKHLNEPEYLTNAQVKQTSLAKDIALLGNYPVDKYPLNKLTQYDADPPLRVKKDPLITEDWSMTAHANAGVNCSACHEQEQPDDKTKWINKPTHEACQACHVPEVIGFLSGKHGMRLKEGLSAMTPAMATQPMRPQAHDIELSCTSCHSAHKFDTQHAAVEACLTCHADQHSKSYKDSPHFFAWHKEITGQAEPDTGVSCATCHLPRQLKKVHGHGLVFAEHNQNMNLRPNEKMLRSVCMNCHGLGFSLDALADKNLVNKNFNGMPSVHIESIDLVKQRLEKSSKPKEGSP